MRGWVVVSPDVYSKGSLLRLLIGLEWVRCWPLDRVVRRWVVRWRWLGIVLRIRFAVLRVTRLLILVNLVRWCPWTWLGWVMRLLCRRWLISMLFRCGLVRIGVCTLLVLVLLCVIRLCRNRWWLTWVRCRRMRRDRILVLISRRCTTRLMITVMRCSLVIWRGLLVTVVVL